MVLFSFEDYFNSHSLSSFSLCKDHVIHFSKLFISKSGLLGNQMISSLFEISSDHFRNSPINLQNVNVNVIREQRSRNIFASIKREKKTSEVSFWFVIFMFTFRHAEARYRVWELRIFLIVIISVTKRSVAIARFILLFLFEYQQKNGDRWANKKTAWNIGIFTYQNTDSTKIWEIFKNPEEITNSAPSKLRHIYC